jgi:hypothetical protein
MLRVDPDVAVRVEIVAEVCAPTDA